MSIQTSSITSPSSGLHQHRSSKVAKALQALALGSAIAFGGGAARAAVLPQENVPPPPDQPVAVQVEQQEKPATEHHCSGSGKLAIGYVSGVLMEKLLRSLRDKNEALEAENTDEGVEDSNKPSTAPKDKV